MDQNKAAAIRAEFGQRVLFDSTTSEFPISGKYADWLESKIADLDRRLAEAEEDSARYQFIRSKSLIGWTKGKKNRISFPTIHAKDPKPGGNFRDRFDAAIDAARKGGGR